MDGRVPKQPIKKKKQSIPKKKQPIPKKKQPIKKNKFSRNLFLLFIIFVVVISLFNFIRLGSGVKETELSYSQFMEMVESQRITEVTIRGHIIRGELGTNMPFKTYAPEDPELIKILRQNGVEIQAAPESSPWLLNYETDAYNRE
jgi:cell division protease FtsH